MRPYGRSLISLLFAAVLGIDTAADEGRKYFYSDIELKAQPWDTVQAVYADFTYLLARIGEAGIFDEHSLSVRHVHENGPAEETLPLHFMKDADYDRREQVSGRIIWRVEGERDSLHAVKKYRVYFAAAENPTEEPVEYGALGVPNLVPNPGFAEEEKPGVPARTPYFRTGSNREAYEDGRLSLDAEIFHSGGKSVKLTVAESKPGAGIVVTPAMGYQENGHDYMLRVQPGRSYRFGYWSRGDQCAEPIYVSGRQAMMVLPWVYWYNSDGTPGRTVRSSVSPVRVAEERLPYSFDWIYNEQILSIQPGTVYAMFSISFPCRSGSVWIDSPIVTLAAPPELTTSVRDEKRESKQE